MRRWQRPPKTRGGASFLDLSFLTSHSEELTPRRQQGLGLKFSADPFSGGGCDGHGDPANRDGEGTLVMVTGSRSSWAQSGQGLKQRLHERVAKFSGK